MTLNIPLIEREPRKPGFFTDFGMKLATGLAAIAIGVVGIKSCYCDNPYNSKPVCEYRIKAGDSLTSILRAEGLSGKALEDAVEDVCGENYDRMMPDGRYPEPVFEQNGTCDNARVGGIISVPKYAPGNTINGQECNTAQ